MNEGVPNLSCIPPEWISSPNSNVRSNLMRSFFNFGLTQKPLEISREIKKNCLVENAFSLVPIHLNQAWFMPRRWAEKYFQ